VITGAGGADTLAGGAGNDIVNAGAGGDRLAGDDGADKLYGEAGADTLIGGLGTDVLNGGADADQFMFMSAVANSRDSIQDFTVGQDKIAIQASGFSAALSPGALDPSWYVVGTSATAVGHGQFVYDSGARILSWDADGQGGAAGTQLAIFAASVNLQASDFLLV